jgi:hypothetical protein
MSSTRKRGFYYQAHANALGGRLDQPFEQILPVLAPTSLPSAGGYASARHEGFRAAEILSVASAYTQVAGSASSEKTFTTLTTSVIEGLNVNNILFADRIAAQISLAFTEGSLYPKVSFLGTELLGLRIAGVELKPEFNFGVFHGPDPAKYPTTSILDSGDFHTHVRDQWSALRAFFESKPKEEQPAHQWAQDFGDPDTITDEGYTGRGGVLCSVVKGFEPTRGTLPGTQVGHAITIPNFGAIFLAELIVADSSFDLTMLRLELGCPVSGTVSAGQAAVATNAGTVATGKTKGSGGGHGSGPP